MPAAFSIETARLRAEEALRLPPREARLARPVPRGSLVASWVLPLELVKPQNRTNHRAAWAYGRDRDRLATLMALQQPRALVPLPGRPMVICTRFSSVEPDAFNDGFKLAIDILCLPSARAPRRLGYLRDDRPADAEVIQRWEPAKQREGFCTVDLYDGRQRRNP